MGHQCFVSKLTSSHYLSRFAVQMPTVGMQGGTFICCPLGNDFELKEQHGSSVCCSAQFTTLHRVGGEFSLHQMTQRMMQEIRKQM